MNDARKHLEPRGDPGPVPKGTWQSVTWGVSVVFRSDGIFSHDNGFLFRYTSSDDLLYIVDTEGNCDGSGALDFFDFLCFQNEFAAGCP